MQIPVWSCLPEERIQEPNRTIQKDAIDLELSFQYKILDVTPLS